MLLFDIIDAKGFRIFFCFRYDTSNRILLLKKNRLSKSNLEVNQRNDFTQC